MMNKRWMIGIGIVVLVLLVSGAGVLLAVADDRGKQALSKEQAVQLVVDQYPGQLLEAVQRGEQYAVHMSLEHGTYEALVDRYSGEIVALQRLTQAVSPELAAGETEREPDAAVTEDEPDGSNSASGELVLADDTEDTSANQPPAKQGEPPAQGNTDPAPSAPPVASPSHGGGSASPAVEVPIAEVPIAEAPVVEAPSAGGNTQSEGAATDHAPAPAYVTEDEAGKIALQHVAAVMVDPKVDDIDRHGRGTSTPYYLVEVDGDDGPDAVVQVHAISGTVMSVVWEQDDDDDDDDDDHDHDDKD